MKLLRIIRHPNSYGTVSHLVCKAISMAPSSSVSSMPFLHSIIEYCVAETTKPKPEQSSMQPLQMALQIVTNCCCCYEGRALINKVSKKNIVFIKKKRKSTKR